MIAKIQNNKKIYIIELLVLGVSFFFLLGENGSCIMRDSAVFMNPSEYLLGSYFLYPVFLLCCKAVFGEGAFLYAAFLIQSVLAMFASIFITEYFRKHFQLDYINSMLIYIVTFLPYGYSLPEDVVSHHIMTEAFAIPLFYVAFVFLLRFLLEKKNYYLLLAVVVGILLFLTRSHMIGTLAVICAIGTIVLIYRSYQKYHNKINFKRIAVILAIVGMLGGIIAFKLVMNTNLSSQLLMATTGRVLCLMEYEDRELFGGELQGIYDHLYQHASEGGHVKEHFRKGVWRPVDIADHTNENSKEWLGTIREYYEVTYPEKAFSEYGEQSYMDGEAIVRVLFEKHIWDYIMMSLQLMSQSFVASVFIQPDSIRALCYFITPFIYLAAVGVMIRAFKKEKIAARYLIPMVLTMIFLVSNVVLTNVVFYGLQRYVIYTFGLFYLSFYLMLIGIYRKRKGYADV